MNFPKNKLKIKSKTQIGLFLFFLSGLFILQIVFSFTIHGDIGPRTDIIPGIEKPASPVLIGKVDSIIEKNYKVSRVSPEGAFAPASKNFVANNSQINSSSNNNKNQVTAQIETQTVEKVEKEKNTVHKTNIERFAEYKVQKGDTLQKISKKLYGNSNMIQPIIRLNRITDERALKLGSTLKVPRSGLIASIKIAE